MALLDLVTGAHVAYGLRKLRDAYTGFAVNVRRASDNATLDIGFLENGDLDVAALETWAAGSDVFIVTWYDQTGGGGHATQTIPANQPKIASSGVAYRDSVSRPRAYWNNSTLVGVSATALSTYSLTAIFVQEAHYDATTRFSLFSLSDRPYQYVQFGTSGKTTYVFYIGDGNSWSGTGDPRETGQPSWRTIQTLDLNGQEITYYRERTADGVYTHVKPVGSNSTVSLGTYKGYMSEAVFFPHLSDADRLIAYNDINDYFLTGPTRINAEAIIPQNWQWHVDLYDWLKTITIPDVTNTLGALTWDGTYSDVNALAQLWLTIYGGYSYFSPSLTDADAPNLTIAEPDWFVLDAGNGKGIEATGTVRIYQSPAAGPFWYTINLALAGGGNGNPHYQQTSNGIRALVSIAVDMIMHDQLQDNSPDYWSLVDFAGGAMNAWFWAYRTFKHLISPTAQAAFETGFSYMAWKLWKWGAHDINGNMDTKAIAALANVYTIVRNPEVRDWCVKGTKKILFGSETGTPETSDFMNGLYRQPGYVDEGDSPETSYNGVSLFHMLEAYSVLQEALSNSPTMRLVLSAGGLNFPLYSSEFD